MKPLLFSLLVGFFLISCDDDDTTIETVVVDSSIPVGDLTATATGTIVGQNDTGTAGMVTLGTDTEGTQFLGLSSSFVTNLGTGTVTVFLSTSETFSPDPMNGNPDLKLVGSIRSNGAQFFKIDPAADSKFTHVIFWCASANIPFGFAEFQ